MRKPYFFDTSALVKLYHQEEGTETLDELLSSQNPLIVISDITIIEMVSAFLKKVRMQIIDHTTCAEAIQCFEDDRRKFTVIAVEKAIKDLSITLLKEFGDTRKLKTLDALQLASALYASQQAQCDVFLVTDSLLAELAKQKGLDVLNLHDSSHNGDYHETLNEFA